MTQLHQRCGDSSWYRGRRGELEHAGFRRSERQWWLMDDELWRRREELGDAATDAGKARATTAVAR
jgi:hypothetical protein